MQFLLKRDRSTPSPRLLVTSIQKSFTEQFIRACRQLAHDAPSDLSFATEALAGKRVSMTSLDCQELMGPRSLAFIFDITD